MIMVCHGICLLTVTASALATLDHTCQVAGAKMREIRCLSQGASTLGGDGCQIFEQKSGSLLRKEGNWATMH